MEANEVEPKTVKIYAGKAWGYRLLNASTRAKLEAGENSANVWIVSVVSKQT